MASIPAVNLAYEDEQPALATDSHVAGAYWQPDWRDNYPVASDEIRNHNAYSFLGIFDGTEAVADWNPWEGVTSPEPDKVIRFGYGSPGIQEYALSNPLAIDSFDRQPDHAQQQLSGVSSIAALVPFIDMPHALPYHYDTGWQRQQGEAIGQRQVFRSPPSYSDQTAAIYAAGF